MFEPASQELRSRLEQWKLCRPGDLRRARGLVGRLARDLPSFDSVWIDALVQLKVLTPYQARILESEEDGLPLLVNDFQLLDEIGRSPRGQTWLVRRIEPRESCVLKRVDSTPVQRERIARAGRELVSRAAGCAEPNLVGPHACWDDARGVWFLSRWVEGVPLAELLVRRGRFPARIVGEIGRQLARGLAGGHGVGLMHGDIRLSHVRVTSSGQVVLVEAGVRPVIEPEVTLHATLSLDAYDGVAPELIGIGQHPTPASDFYALGCLLWQLLTGRPPFAVADPLAKLAAHQTRSIEDVREWAPQTPPALAELVGQLTQREPAQRPKSAEEILAALQAIPSPGRSGLKAFRRQLNVTVPHLNEMAERRMIGWPAIATGLAVAAVAVTLLADSQRRTELLSVTKTWLTGSLSPDAGDSPTPVPPDPRGGLVPLPAPGPDGVILLKEPGPYAVGSIQHAGPVHLQGLPGVCPQILVRDTPLRVSCSSLRLENIHIRRDLAWPATQSLKALMVVQSQQLELVGTSWDLGDRNPRRPDISPAVGVAWRLIEPLDPQAGYLVVENSQFRGMGTAIFSSDAARAIRIENCLRLGGEFWIELQVSERARPVTLSMRHVTVRESQGLVRYRSDSVDTRDQLLAVNAIDCVLSLSDTNGMLIAIDTPQVPEFGDSGLVWAGESTLMPAGVSVARWLPNGGAGESPTGEELATDHLSIDGLVAGRWTFSGLPTSSVGDSALNSADIPRRTLEWPGIVVDRFSSCLGGSQTPKFPEGLESPPMQGADPELDLPPFDTGTLLELK